MIDIDYGPGVFAVYILAVFILPFLYSFIVDKYWKQHQADQSMSKDADAFKQAAFDALKLLIRNAAPTSGIFLAWRFNFQQHGWGKS